MWSYEEASTPICNCLFLPNTKNGEGLENEVMQSKRESKGRQILKSLSILSPNAALDDQTLHYKTPKEKKRKKKFTCTNPTTAPPPPLLPLAESINQLQYFSFGEIDLLLIIIILYKQQA